MLAKLEEKGLKPARPADKRVLIRRATLDLTGLPPTPEEVDAFLADQSPDAFAKVVDRLLASPRYGERWGRYWLDVARYADDKLNSTQEEPYPNAFRYRDWVIQAFNDDMPYDLFVKAQIAGDLLTSDDPLQYQPGLGFYALSPGDAGRSRGCHHARISRTDRGLRAVPRPQVRSDSAEGLLLAAGSFLQHRADAVPLAPKDDRREMGRAEEGDRQAAGAS